MPFNHGDEYNVAFFCCPTTDCSRMHPHRRPQASPCKASAERQRSSQVTAAAPASNGLLQYQLGWSWQCRQGCGEAPALLPSSSGAARRARRGAVAWGAAGPGTLDQGSIFARQTASRWASRRVQGADGAGCWRGGGCGATAVAVGNHAWATQGHQTMALLLPIASCNSSDRIIQRQREWQLQCRPGWRRPAGGRRPRQHVRGRDARLPEAMTLRPGVLKSCH